MYKRHIITGAPGTGKTSLIDALCQQGYHCEEEVSRKVIKAQQEQEGDKTPWNNVAGFVDLVYQQTIKELQEPINSAVFVDRGLPDCIAYLYAKGISVSEYIITFPYTAYYETIVFATPPWENIYVNDPQRPQSYSEALQIHKHLMTVYQSLGFVIDVLPKTTVLERVAYIQKKMPIFVP